LAVFPDNIGDALQAGLNNDQLIEVVIDLGRKPQALFTDGGVTLSEKETEQADIDAVVNQVGQFMGDNRAGLERTLHRISCIRNRQGKIIGLTCRVGRAVYGTIDIIQDLLESGQSVLLLGRPGVGKTTLLREAARILAESKRVVVVDTSNEIAGDGDIPHPAIGKARRMQVPRPELQHEVMIEAVENHTPEVIIIDEIGRLEEAEAARTIAERGVQLIGTAHGNTLENLLINPTLSDLVGHQQPGVEKKIPHGSIRAHASVESAEAFRRVISECSGSGCALVNCAGPVRRWDTVSRCSRHPDNFRSILTARAFMNSPPRWPRGWRKPVLARDC
jgi:stage III sporulation protein SpoIIIAA